MLSASHAYPVRSPLLGMAACGLIFCRSEEIEMQVVGLFRELTREKPAFLPSIIDAKGKLAAAQVSQVAAFLRRGVPVFDVMEATPDPFDPKTFLKGGPSLVSDGHWVWREDLAHYVERYQVGLPSQFIAHVQQSNGSIADESTIVSRWEEAVTAYEQAEREPDAGL